MHTRARVRALGCALLLLLAGCRLQLQVGVDVGPSGGGTLGVRLTADPQLLAEAARAGADPLGDLAAAGADLAGDGWETSDATAADGSRTVELTAGFADPAEFDALAADLAATLDGDELRLLEPLRLRQREGRLLLSGTASLRPGPAIRDYGLTRAEALRLLRRREPFTYEVRATFPGEVIRSTAPVTDGSTLRWPVAPGESVDVVAVGERPEPPPLRILAGGLAGGAVAVGVLLLALARRRSSSELAHERSAHTLASRF